MLRITHHRLVVAFAPLALLGCAGTAGTVFDPMPFPKGRIDAAGVTLRILDSRAVRPHKFDVPVVTLPGQKDDAPMQADTDIQSRMLERVRRLVGNGSGDVHFDVEVTEATAGWKANSFSEEEHASVKLRVQAYDHEGGRAVGGCSGESWGQSWSADSSEQQVLDIYRQTFLDAFERCIFSETGIRAINAGIKGEMVAIPGSSPKSGY